MKGVLLPVFASAEAALAERLEGTTLAALVEQLPPCPPEARKRAPRAPTRAALRASRGRGLRARARSLVRLTM